MVWQKLEGWQTLRRRSSCTWPLVYQLGGHVMYHMHRVFLRSSIDMSHSPLHQRSSYLDGNR